MSSLCWRWHVFRTLAVRGKNISSGSDENKAWMSAKFDILQGDDYVWDGDYDWWQYDWTLLKNPRNYIRCVEESQLLLWEKGELWYGTGCYTCMMFFKLIHRKFVCNSVQVADKQRCRRGISLCQMSLTLICPVTIPITLPMDVWANGCMHGWVDDATAFIFNWWKNVRPSRRPWWLKTYTPCENWTLNLRIHALRIELREPTIFCPMY